MAARWRELVDECPKLKRIKLSTSCRSSSSNAAWCEPARRRRNDPKSVFVRPRPRPKSARMMSMLRNEGNDSCRPDWVLDGLAVTVTTAI